jgi:hypothetical protein
MMVNEGYNAIVREIDLTRLANVGTEVQKICFYLLCCYRAVWAKAGLTKRQSALGLRSKRGLRRSKMSEKGSTKVKMKAIGPQKI